MAFIRALCHYNAKPNWLCSSRSQMILSQEVKAHQCRLLSSSSTRGDSQSQPQQLSKKDQLKRAVKDYGATVIVFHVAISLVSLGGFYTAVSSGIDVVSLLRNLPYIGEQVAESSVGKGASTFVMAYAIHKVFAPVRISITLTSTPFIVQYLRRRGILKIKTK